MTPEVGKTYKLEAGTFKVLCLQDDPGEEPYIAFVNGGGVTWETWCNELIGRVFADDAEIMAATTPGSVWGRDGERRMVLSVSDDVYWFDASMTILRSRKPFHWCKWARGAVLLLDGRSPTK